MDGKLETWFQNIQNLCESTTLDTSHSENMKMNL